MRPVKSEDRVTYGLEWYATVEDAEARGVAVVNQPHTVHAVADGGRNPLFDRHDYTTGAQLYAVVVP